MKDIFYKIMVMIMFVLILANDISQDRKINDLQDEVNSLNEQITYVEGEIG